MNDEVCTSTSVPTDDEGYVLLKCEYCGNFFKGTPSDLQDGGVLHVLYPSCRLISNSYTTDDVLGLATRMATNCADDIIYGIFKNSERHNRMNNMIKFKVERKPHHETEDPIRPGIKALEIYTSPYYKHTARVKSLLKITGAYRPFCEVKNYEVE